MEASVDLERYKLKTEPNSKNSVRSSQRTKRGFVKGPIPLDWMATAARLPGKALHVGVILWYLSGLKRTKERIPLSNIRVQRFGLRKDSKRRALEQLRRAGLISVDVRSGRSPVVTIHENLREDTK